MEKEDLAYVLFMTQNGRQELFVGKDKLAIMSDTKGGRDFGGCNYISSRFLSYSEAQRLEIGNFNDAVEAVLAGNTTSFFVGGNDLSSTKTAAA
jgi:hypothetical protein